MAEVVNVGANAYDVRKSVAQMPYSKVIINVEQIGDNKVISYIAGDDTGETLELDCPWGTQDMANNLLESVRGYKYQPYTVTSAIINPAVELGDAINTNGVYGGNYQQDATFTHTFYSDFSAPQDEQLDHEFTYESPTERKLSRQQAWAKSTFQIQHDNIEARVTKKSGDIEENSFSWRLLSDEFGLYAGTKKVFRCYKDGIMVDGEIRARTGYIGSDSQGFVINAKNIHNGMETYNDSQHNGVYLGTDGIGLGAGKFTVTSSGVLNATSATVSGTITAKSGKIGADSSGNNGFDITTNAIKNGKTSYSETDNNGVYIGTSGIGLGKGVFYVDNKGNVTANNITVKGKLGGSSGFTVADGKFYSGSKTSYDSNTTGVYVGTDGIGLGAGKFYVTSGGALTAKDIDISGKVTATSGKIGSDSNAWNIGAKSIYNGTDSLTSTTQGAYVGIDGLRIYNSDTQSFTFKKDGTIDIRKGMNGFGDTTNTSGFYLGADGLVFGGGKLKLAKDGTITAKKGVIGSDSSAWNIGTKSIYNGTDSLTSTTQGAYVGIDGIRIYNSDTASFTFKKDGTIDVRKGMNGFGDTTNTSGFYLGADGFALGGGNLKLAKDGTLTAKKGYIGNGSNGFEIKSNQLFNGKDGIDNVDNASGVFIGVNGIGLGRVGAGTSADPYRTAFKVTSNGTLTAEKATITGAIYATSGTFAGSLSSATGTFAGNLSACGGTFSGDLSACGGTFKGDLSACGGTFKGELSAATGSFKGSIDVANGNFAVDSSGNVTIKRGSININSGVFAVDSTGSLSATKGSIAGWSISSNSLSKLTESGGTVTSHVGMSSSASVSFFAGQSATPGDCAFKVMNTGKVYLTQLFTRVVDTSAPGYDEDDPSTWTWIDSQIDLGQNGFKIGNDYKTIRSVSSDGTVRLSNGSSFKSAASVYCKGSWSGEISSGQTLTVKPKVTTTSGEKDAGGASFEMKLNGQWIKEPYYYGDNTTIFAVMDNNSSIHLEAGKISATCEYNSETSNYSIIVKSGDQKIYQDSAGFSKMNVTRVQTEITSQGASRYYGKLYFWNAVTNKYQAASDNDHYWYYSNVNKTGTSTLYYK